MRSFASLLVVIALGASSVQFVRADTSSARTLYTDALLRERALRHDLETRRSDEPEPALLKRMRTLVKSYEQMSRQFPSSAYMDNALWQGALLAADAFWTFGEAEDKTTALEMFSELGSRFPKSSLVKDLPPHVKRLKAAKPTPVPALAAAAPVTTAPAAAAAVATMPVSSRVATSGRVTNALKTVKREVLPDALRITLELGQEVTFRSDRLDAPPRVFIDFENTRPVEAIKDATIPFPDDVVRKVRIGRQTESRTRVVMDLAGAGRYSVYTLYNPYRVVIDFTRLPITPSALIAATTTPTVPVISQTSAKPDVAAPVLAATPQPPSSKDANTPILRGPIDDPDPVPVETAAAAPSLPTPPSVNRSGSFSLSRQLGLRVSRVVIDPGHGGHDPGAKTKGLTEADLVLDVALRLEQLLSKQDGFEVVLTRRVDTFVPLEERTAIANREGADLFLSIHANASTNSSARGIETYFLNLTTNPDAEMVAARENAASSRSMNQLPDIVKAIALNNKIQESRDFASMIQSSLHSQLQKSDSSVRNLGVKQAPFMVLLGATMPSVLAEISFITNRQDAALLKTEKYRQRIAEALYAGVLRYQQSLKTGPAIAEQ
ncbi:MAG TPA: N-acetylmuramoyl-L-alanine amidase [Vicinamibacterales bacterium]|nr:N-acetylmuramoyl-L-alanine amidase [Vicinamibacterales bacterium]